MFASVVALEDVDIAVLERNGDSMGFRRSNNQRSTQYLCVTPSQHHRIVIDTRSCCEISKL